jgi:glycosyltransferase involved in cell wall biosynthesis
MKILLSAYACEPNRGSEPEVGWNWALELARRSHEVYVLTRANSRAPIEADLANLPPLPNLHFIYYDLPAWLRWWKRGLKGVHFYYLLWQIGAFFKAASWHKNIHFDRVHHATFVSIRQPSLMGLLGIPFVFGPVAGGERAPYRLRRSYPLQGWLKDALRDCLNALIFLDPLMHLTFATANKIYVTSHDTLRLLPPWYRKKASVQLAIGLPPLPNKPTVKSNGEGFKILYVGNLLYLKGIHLALRAFAQFAERYPNAHFTLIGGGPDADWLKVTAAKLGLAKQLTWISSMPREELLNHYVDYDVLLFPSLHDSGGMVVLEALSNGLPVVCLDIGGPGQIVTSDCGMVIPTQNAGEEAIIHQMAGALDKIASFNEAQRHAFSTGAIQRASKFTWSEIINACI